MSRHVSVPLDLALKQVIARPMCGRCRRPVDRVEEYHDKFLDRVVFRAFCHGAVERVDLDENDLRASKGFGNLTMGVAFAQTKALPETTEGGTNDGTIERRG